MIKCDFFVTCEFHFIGVADGVGGWRAYGIDPGEFSMHLMRTCERLVKLGRFTPNNPSDLLARSYYELLHHKKAILGKFLYYAFSVRFNLEDLFDLRWIVNKNYF